MLSQAEREHSDTQPVISLAHLDGLDLRRAPDGWHGIWQVEGATHQFWLPDATPDAAACYVLVLPMDMFLDVSFQQVVQRQLQVDPTLTIRPGFPVRILVTRDLVFEPEGG